MYMYNTLAFNDVSIISLLIGSFYRHTPVLSRHDVFYNAASYIEVNEVYFI
jgi:hypothetical protein